MTEDNSPSPEDKPARQKWISERARDALQEAVDRGEFDHLPGQGKPLDLTKDDNPFVPEELKLSYRILSNAGFGVPWIEARKDIDRLRAKLEREISLREARLQVMKVNLERAPAYLRTTRATRLKAELESSIGLLRRTAVALNRRIDDYNLVVPATSVQTSRIDVLGIVGRFTNQFAID